MFTPVLSEVEIFADTRLRRCFHSTSHGTSTEDAGFGEVSDFLSGSHGSKVEIFFGIFCLNPKLGPGPGGEVWNLVHIVMSG
jgi:hypothetical protein